MIKQTIFKYLTGFQLVMVIFMFLLTTYGMPENYYEMAVYLTVAIVAAYVYGKDKSTGVDLKKIDLTPQEEYTIKHVLEWIFDLLGWKATIEATPDDEVCEGEPDLSMVPLEVFAREIARRKNVDG